MWIYWNWVIFIRFSAFTFPRFYGIVLYCIVRLFFRPTKFCCPRAPWQSCLTFHKFNNITQMHKLNHSHEHISMQMDTNSILFYIEKGKRCVKKFDTDTRHCTIYPVFRWEECHFKMKTDTSSRCSTQNGKFQWKLHILCELSSVSIGNPPDQPKRTDGWMEGSNWLQIYMFWILFVSFIRTFGTIQIMPL